MAIKITENGAVKYVNENDVDRTLFPNLSGAMGDEQYDALNGRLTVVEGKVADLEECCDDVNTDIGAIKNDLSELSSAYSAFVVETETGSIASFSDGADGVPVKDLQVAIEPVQSGSGDPSPSNVRPISGWTGANVTRTGKNLFDFESANYYNDNIYLGGDYSSVGVVTDGSLVLGAGTYTVSANANMTDWYLYDKTGRIDTKYNSNSFTFTLAEEKEVCIDTYLADTPTKENFAQYDLQLELGSTATAYEPYQGETYEVDWTTEAGTVYGGTLDVTTGVLTVNWVKITYQSVNGNIESNGFRLSQRLENITNSYGELKCNILERASSYSDAVNRTNATPNRIGYNDVGLLLLNVYINGSQLANITDLNAFIAENGGLEITYPASNPTTYQLTPQEVATVLGQNNIFADCGDVTVQYRADTKLYIDKVLST